MTVSSTVLRNDYSGNGVTTAFTGSFRILDQTHIQVLRTQISTGVATTLALTTDYTVSGVGASSFTVTCLTAPTSDQRLTILRDVPLTQLTDYVANDPFPAESHEQALDKLTMISQQLQEAQSRALSLSANSVGVSATLPAAESAKILGWDGSGTALANYDAASLAGSVATINWTHDTFSGTGAQTSFTLTSTPGSADNCDVSISGVTQRSGTDYTVSGVTLTFTSAPPLGTDNIFVRYGSQLSSGVPGDGTVTAAKMEAAYEATLLKTDDIGVSVQAYAATPGNTNDFRLTLTSGTPVTVTDVTGATTIYCTPYKGNKIALYDGSVWNVRTSAQFSLALGTLTASLPYDVFCYDNSGTPTLEFTAWTNATTRATALTYQDGILVKTGATTRRYLGTFYTTSTTQTEDSEAKRYLWNYYHRAEKNLYKSDTTATWNYTTATWRQARADATNQIEFVCGVAEDMVSARVQCGFSNPSGAVGGSVGIGVDATNANSAKVFGAWQSTGGQLTLAEYAGAFVGRHYLAWLEYSAASGTTTWYGSAAFLQSGITGKVLC